VSTTTLIGRTHQERVLAGSEALRRRFYRGQRWSKIALWTGVGIIGLVLVASLVTTFFGLGSPNEGDLTATLQPPSFSHPFGTDALGRDVFVRCLYGARIDLLFGVVTTYVPLLLGLALGVVAGYFGGLTETVVMRLVDVVMAFPFLVLALAIIAVVGPGLTGAYIGVILVSWAIYARLARAEMLVVREQQYIFAAQTLGYSTPRILCRHASPNVLRACLVFSMVDIVLNILFLTSLSYLGLGVQPPTPELGSLILDGQTYILDAWWISTLPGLVVVMLGTGFMLIGDVIAERLGMSFRKLT
jgi:peptide/nickel transport system permease protein